MISDNHPTRDRKNYSSETIKKPRIKNFYGSSQGHFFILGFALLQNCFFFYFSLSTQSGRSVCSLLSEPAAICILMLSNT